MDPDQTAPTGYLLLLLYISLQEQSDLGPHCLSVRLKIF